MAQTGGAGSVRYLHAVSPHKKDCQLDFNHLGLLGLHQLDHEKRTRSIHRIQ